MFYSEQKQGVIGLVRKRLDACRAGGTFSPAAFGKDFGIWLEINGDHAIAFCEAFTPEGATYLMEMVEAGAISNLRAM